MGLFDSLNYDPSTYADNGGLIGRLLAQLGTQNQYQPGAGLPPTPMDANASVPAPAVPQASPIAIGDYQMPRIGTAAAFTPPTIDPQTDETADQPRSAPRVQAAPSATEALPAFLQPQPPQSSSGGLGGAFRGMAANTGAGPIGMLIGGIGGALGMGKGTPEEQRAAEQNRVLRQNYAALVQAGVPEQKAMLAAINPEYGKAIVAEALSNKQKFVQLKDAMGAEHPAFVDETNQTVNGKPISALPQDSSGAGSGLGDMSKTGAEYLATIPVAQRGTVQGMVEGTLAPPSSFALSKPYWQNMIAAAKNVDPTWDSANWSGRVAGVKDFSAGKSAEMVRSANQTLHHTGALLDSMDALNNGDYPLKNWVGNTVNEATGGGAPTAFRLNAHAVAEEMSKVFKGANLSDTEIKSWEHNLSENMSPGQQRAAVGKLKDLLQGSLQALDEKRVASMGPMAADKAGPIIKPEGQRVLQRIEDWLKKGTGAAQGTSPAQTKTGVSWSVVQ